MTPLHRWLALAVFASVARPLFAQPTVPANDRLQLWYDRPASYWEEALPVGNGRIGAMIFGGVAREHIQLNEATIWSGAPTAATSSHDEREHLQQQTALLLQGRYREAQDLKLPSPATPGETIAGSSALHVYQPLGDLYLHFNLGTSREENYRRSLDLDRAVATTTYEVDGVHFTREVWASYPAQALVIRLTADRPGALTFAATLDYRKDVADDMYRYDAELGPKVANVTTPPRPTWSALDRTHFSWRSQAHPQGVTYDAHFEVKNEQGSVTPLPNGFRVEGANAVTLVMTVGTDFRGGNPTARATRDLAALDGTSYDALLAAHLTDYRSLFRRVDFELGRTRLASMPTNRRIMAQNWGVQDNRVDPTLDRDPALSALYFQYGRYLMIASSRPGSLPPALQGLWNDSLLPPWFGQHTSDINVEMNYWPVETTNLAECHTALLDLVESFQPAAAASARLGYGARGLVINSMTNWGPKRVGSEWPDFSGWLSRHFWEHYAFSGDRAFLSEHAYPMLKGCALFYLDTLVTDPRTGQKITGPSYSPENRYLVAADGKPASVDVGVTMSMAICRDVFRNFLKASSRLDRDAELRAQVQAALDRLAPYAIGQQGRLQEWREDFGETEPGHRHFSPLYPLFPGDEFTPRSTPALTAAAGELLKWRLAHFSAWTGWSRAWSINLAARLHDPVLAYQQLKLQLERTTFPNLMDSHPRLGGNTACFQIDGNFGTTAAIAEMLLQSHAGEIELLPALPAEWKQGSISGLRARGGFTVGQTWKDGALTEATLAATISGPCVVRTAGPIRITSAVKAVAKSTAEQGSHVTRFAAEAGATYRIVPAR